MSGVPVTRARDDGRLVSVHNVYLGPWAAAHWAAPPDTYQHVRWHMGTVPPQPPSTYAGFYPNIFIAEMLAGTVTDRYLFDERKVAQRLQCHNATTQCHIAAAIRYFWNTINAYVEQLNSSQLHDAIQWNFILMLAFCY